jgi:phosphoribosyl-AMP cyclohydrolase
MRTRHIFSALAALALLAALASLAGCPASIYYTLENEVETPDSTLKNEISILGIAKLGSAYYAAAGTIWKGAASAGGVIWDTTNPLTPPSAGALCNSLVQFGGDLYGGFFTQSSNVGLYNTAGTLSSFAGAQVADFAGKQISYLGVVNAGTRIAVATADWNSTAYVYNLYVALTPDGTGHIVTDASSPIRGVAYTGATGLYWAVTGSTLYQSNGGATPTAVPITGAASGETLTNVFSDDESLRLFVTSDKGFVYYSPDEGATWYKNADAAEVSTTVVSFLTVAGVSGSNNMLVGSDGYGYFMLAVGTAPTLTRFNVNTIGLYSGSVRQFLIDGTRLFACTNAKGLWRNESFDSATCAVGAWSQE